MPGTKKSNGRTTPKKASGRTTKKAAATSSGVPVVATSAQDWNKAAVPEEEGFTVELPSGNAVMMRRTLDLPVLLRTGQIPNPLAAIVRRMMDTLDPNFKTGELTGETLWQFLDLIDTTIVRCVISPKLSTPERRQKKQTWEEWADEVAAWEPDPNTVSIFDVEMNDKLFIFSLAQGMAADLASFRGIQNAAMASLQASGDVEEPPRRTPRPSATKPRKRGAKARA